MLYILYEGEELTILNGHDSGLDYYLFWLLLIVYENYLNELLLTIYLLTNIHKCQPSLVTEK